MTSLLRNSDRARLDDSSAAHGIHQSHLWCSAGGGHAVGSDMACSHLWYLDDEGGKDGVKSGHSLSLCGCLSKFLSCRDVRLCS